MDRSPSPETVRAWALLMRVSRQLLESVEASLKKAGLPPLVWYDVLHELAKAGTGGLRQAQLVEKMLLAQYNVSRLLARMEKDELVLRRHAEEDGRGQTITIRLM
ncbi:MAG: helix-turn-helix domain-containing protein [Pseudomonadota bacterium]|nr:helix-turn-helix domain-containing protein [Pseudomonadota bacterium]